MNNRYGVDITYFKKWIARAFKDISNYKPDELDRELARMSRTADESVLLESEFAGATIEAQAAVIEKAEAQIDGLLLDLEEMHQSLNNAHFVDQSNEARIAELEGAITEHKGEVISPSKGKDAESADLVLWELLSNNNEGAGND